MVFLDRFAQTHLENCIVQRFQEAAPEIYPNPFQGLKIQGIGTIQWGNWLFNAGITGQGA